MSNYISKSLAEEIERASSLYNVPPDKDSFKEHFILVEQISNAVLLEIEKEVLTEPNGNLDEHIIFGGLLNLLMSGRYPIITSIWAGAIFDKIDNALEKKKESEKGKLRISNISHIQKGLEIVAIEYFRRKNTSEIKNLDLPQRLSKVKQKISEKHLLISEFEQKALLELQNEIENAIAIKKEELAHRKEFENLTEVKKEGKLKNEISIHADLNQRTATLFLSYLLDYAKEKSRENHGLKHKKTLSAADKNRIIDFLTPISGKQSKKLHKPFKDEIAKIAEKEEISKKFYNDMQVIRKYFEMLGLSEITDKIDADLGEK
jgi:hypothetical protein